MKIEIRNDSGGIGKRMKIVKKKKEEEEETIELSYSIKKSIIMIVSILEDKSKRERRVYFKK